jgi:hypothetical protein
MAREEKDVHVPFSPLTSDSSFALLNLYNPRTEWPSPLETKPGPYEIIAAIGASRQGKVYRVSV